MNSTRTLWTSTDEQMFLDGLGSWGTKRRDRARLLKGYIEGNKQRRTWWQPRGSRNACIHYAANLLKTEGK